jgi:hypothetical protein
MMHLFLVEQVSLCSFITSYYKNLFGAPERGNLSMDETQIADVP